jgi:flagellar hook-length control protein FliK
MFSLQAQFNSPVPKLDVGGIGEYAGGYAYGSNTNGGYATGSSRYSDGSSYQDKSSFFELFAPRDAAYSDKNASGVTERSASEYKREADASSANAAANTADRSASESDSVSDSAAAKDDKASGSDEAAASTDDKETKKGENSADIEKTLLILRDGLLRDDASKIQEFEQSMAGAVTINVDLEQAASESESVSAIEDANGASAQGTELSGQAIGELDLEGAELGGSAKMGELKAAAEKNARLASGGEASVHDGGKDLASAEKAASEGAAKAGVEGGESDEGRLSAKKGGAAGIANDALGMNGELAAGRAGGRERGANGGASREGGRGSGERAKPTKIEAERARIKASAATFVTTSTTQAVEGASSGGRETMHTTDSSGHETEVVVDMKDAHSVAQNAGQNTQQNLSFSNQAKGSMENFLARELHSNLNGDIVRQAQLQLRSSNEATIKLALKPESLGNVKIRLEMTENKVTGKIIVESEEALRAFNEEVHNIEEAFRDSGFAGASIETHLAESGGGGQRGNSELAALRSSFNEAQYDDENDAVVSTRTYSMFFADKKVSVLV